MPFQMKVQPIDSRTVREPADADSAKPVLKSRLKRLFDRQFPNVLRISSAEKPTGNETHFGKDGGTEFEPSSVCLAKMVQNFIEESNDKQSAAKCGRNLYNCFNGNSNDRSDDEFDAPYTDFINPVPSCGDACEILKSLVPCASVDERNLLADAAKIVEQNKTCKRKDQLKKIMTDSLSVLGYDASICKSRWDKSPSHPAGEYEYIDVIMEGGVRLLIDVDFISEFEIARSTGMYKAILQSLPYIFVGKSDRLQQIVSIVSEAARQSLKKKGLYVPPWRKPEYLRAKWISPYTRTTSLPYPPQNDAVKDGNIVPKTEGEAAENENSCSAGTETGAGALDLIFGEGSCPEVANPEKTELLLAESSGGKVKSSTSVVKSTWQLPAIKPKSCERGAKVVTGLAFLLNEKKP
ncbi:hypothetical protein Nepgr_030340 [Nepenthes gracilis]|uniref:Uncharacterized protein n=1 Tax=Nepenthes gracilis TaxID=150966 RepID=A0AAD3Y3T4_NEPGR|nr:hypothetical protein Nepgr_030340 [Nepenthes gracilis]